FFLFRHKLRLSKNADHFTDQTIRYCFFVISESASFISSFCSFRGNLSVFPTFIFGFCPVPVALIGIPIIPNGGRPRRQLNLMVPSKLVCPWILSRYPFTLIFVFSSVTTLFFIVVLKWIFFSSGSFIFSLPVSLLIAEKSLKPFNFTFSTAMSPPPFSDGMIGYMLPSSLPSRL